MPTNNQRSTMCWPEPDGDEGLTEQGGTSSNNEMTSFGNKGKLLDNFLTELLKLAYNLVGNNNQSL